LLTDEQRAELESHDPATVRTKLIQAGPGRGASVSGFKTGELTRGDVEDWLVEKHIEQVRVQDSTLRWAKIAGWAGIASAIVGLVAIIVTIWLAK
jgi:hypothetical protein